MAGGIGAGVYLQIDGPLLLETITSAGIFIGVFLLIFLSWWSFDSILNPEVGDDDEDHPESRQSEYAYGS